MLAYYNEIDPYCAQWLRNLIEQNLIAPGVVDERDIRDVKPYELAPYKQCHFFAGIGGWSLALRLADIPDDFPVWTGSCPCQPFSAAGQGNKFADERHLWPSWHHLIAQQRPDTLFGEQVASKAGLEWFDLVWSDLENSSYSVGVSDLGAASVGAPHIRQRLWFVAHRALDGRREKCSNGSRSIARNHTQGIATGFESSIDPRELAHPNGGNASAERLQRSGEQRFESQDSRAVFLGNADDAGSQGWRFDGNSPDQRTIGAASVVGELVDPAAARLQGSTGQSGDEEWIVRGITGARCPWSDVEWLPCTDGKARPVEPGTFPLAHGIPNRVGRLRAYGNAIIPQVAAEFIRVALKS